MAKASCARPFTAVVAFDSKTHTETLAKNIYKLSPEQRVDFVLIVNPQLSDADMRSTGSVSASDYIAHWYYATPGVGRGKINFATAYDAASELLRLDANPEDVRHIYLTWGRSEHALMWFYLFLIASINSMETQVPDLWEYTQASRANLGYGGDSSSW